MARYQEAYATGELQRRAQDALRRLECCEMCPRRCRVNRLAGELGFCRTGRYATVGAFHIHMGEEAPLVGRTGSGTIFFGHCNLDCRFCQNWDLSHAPAGEVALREVGPQELADIMFQLQAENAMNLNLVSPSHVAAQVLEALAVAVPQGVALPLVWNSGGYDSQETLALLDGVVDIYMPDVKVWDPEVARRLLGVSDYPEVARAALREMHRQVGDLHADGWGVARRGLLVRHLVLPGGLAGTREWMEFIAREISEQTYVNVMEQYRPCGEAGGVAGIARAVTAEECAQAREMAEGAGLKRLDDRCLSTKAMLERLLQMMDDEG